jgi:hypothetical protein
MDIEIMKSTTTTKVIRSLQRIFATHGIPEIVRSDNGPQFVSEEMTEYFRVNGITHQRVTEYWPQGNGGVERQNRSLLKVIRIAKSLGKDWKEEIYTYLREYRCTPHAMTGKSPSELLFGRNIRGKIPEILETRIDYDAIKNDKEQKERMKNYADKKRGAKQCTIKEGDTVLVKLLPGSKTNTRFGKRQYTVIQKNGNQVVLRAPDGKTIRRNVTAVMTFKETSVMAWKQGTTAPPGKPPVRRSTRNMVSTRKKDFVYYVC